MRSLTNVRFILLDEAYYFRISDQEDARTTSERYIAKSNTRILIASTPGAPAGLMERIQNEEPSLYNKIYLPYQVALGSIFNKEEIQENKKSPSFAQEYEYKETMAINCLRDTNKEAFLQMFRVLLTLHVRCRRMSLSLVPCRVTEKSC